MKTYLTIALLLGLLLVAPPAFGQVRVLVGQYGLMETIPELGLQYKGGSTRVLVLFDPQDPVGNGSLYVHGGGNSKWLFEYRNAIYEVVRNSDQTITLYRR